MVYSEQPLPSEAHQYTESNPSKDKGQHAGYLEIYIRFLYYLCFVPYHPTRTKYGCVLERNWVQLVICASLYILAILHQLREMVLVFQINILAEPLQVLELAFGFADSLYIYFWVCEIWSKSSHLSKLILLTSNSTYSSQIRPAVLYTKYFLTFICPFLLFWLVLNENGLWTVPMKSFGGTNNTEVEQVIHWCCDEASLVHFLTLLPLRFIYVMIDVVLLILTMFSYEMTSWVVSTFQVGLQMSDKRNKSIRHTFENDVVQEFRLESQLAKYIQVTDELKQYFSTLNNFSSGLFIGWFSMTVVWYSFVPLKTLEYNHFPYNFIHSCIHIFVFGTIWVASAETKRQVQLFQNVVEEHLLQHNLKSPPDLGRTRPVLKYVKWVISDCGVNVGRFFQISYGSLGNIIGLIIAYSFLYIQFYASQQCKCNNEIGST